MAKQKSVKSSQEKSKTINKKVALKKINKKDLKEKMGGEHYELYTSGSACKSSV
jgi:hypothetical protein